MIVRKSWALLLVGVLFGVHGSSVQARMMVVEKSVAVVPIIVATDASADTSRAAEDLAAYIEKISDAKPTILNGCPNPLPKHAVWVGYSPELNQLFPKTDFTFKYPEEILLVGNENHLAIVGRDRVLGGQQVEFGTANAVYTFLQDKLGVRWFWPGASGEDIIRQDTLAFAPFEQRYHPQFRRREIHGINVAHWRQTLAPETQDWTRYQRLLLGSLRLKDETSFYHWGERYHETHPEYLALQPDGTREPPRMEAAKVCMSNPKVGEQWLVDVEAKLKDDPSGNVFGASPSDGYHTGICVCKDCRSLDVQTGPIWGQYVWKGLGQEYVAMSDRYAIFVNRLAKKLKGRFPDRDLYVHDMAYGPNTPAPLQTVLADNTIIGYVGNFPLCNEVSRQEQKAKFAAWSKKAPHVMYRPNCGYGGGTIWGLPEVAMDHTIEDFRFLADHNCIGLFLDSAFGHWGTQGIQYYLYAQLAWNPRQDGKALLADYYRRAFGPAAGEIEQYWQIMDAARAKGYANPKHRQDTNLRWSVIANILQEVFTTELLKQADETLRRAEAAAKSGPEKYQERVAFIRAGFVLVEKIFESATLVEKVNESSGADTQSIAGVAALWKDIESLAKQFPFAVDYGTLMIVIQMEKGVPEVFGPLSDAYLEGLQKETSTTPVMPAKTKRVEKVSSSSASLEEAGWKLAFQDSFDRDELGKDWIAAEGKWSIDKGELVSSGGLLMATRAFPGFQRIEFEAMTEAKPVVLFADPSRNTNAMVSDLSVIVQSQRGTDPLEKGYFFQFGGMANTINKILRAGVELWREDAPEHKIISGKTHHVVVENDEGHLRFIVDGNVLYDGQEAVSLVGEGQDRIGFYFYSPTRVRNVKVYVKELHDGLL